MTVNNLIKTRQNHEEENELLSYLRSDELNRE